MLGRWRRKPATCRTALRLEIAQKYGLAAWSRSATDCPGGGSPTATSGRTLFESLSLVHCRDLPPELESLNAVYRSATARTRYDHARFDRCRESRSRSTERRNQGSLLASKATTSQGVVQTRTGCAG